MNIGYGNWLCAEESEIKEWEHHGVMALNERCELGWSFPCIITIPYK